MSVVSAWAAPVQAAIVAIAKPAVIASKARCFAFTRLLPCFLALPVFRQGWLRKLHLPQHGAAGETIGVRQRLQKLEMVIRLADDQLGGFARGRNSREELLRLALEFRRLASAVGENE